MEQRAPGSNGPWTGKQHAPGGLLHLIEVAAFIGVRAPDRVCIDVARMLPMRNVVILNGDGGVGKSLLALQLALACATILANWIGIEVDHGPVIYFSAEDDQDEIHKRVEEICEAEGADMQAGVGSLYFAALAGEDATLGIEDKNTLKPTELYKRLDATMTELSPLLVVLDNLADVYAGNENNRTLVKHFIGLLRKLAIKHDCVILLLAHPSVAGMINESGTSGSTAWNNSVRARMYLKRVLNGDKSEDDECVRELQVMKANYSAKGEPLQLRWEHGRFVRKAKDSAYEGVPAEFFRQVQTAFADAQYRADQRSPDWGGYRVGELLDLDLGNGLTGAQRSGQQKRNCDKVAHLLTDMVKSGAIRIVRRADHKREQRNFYEG